MIPFRVRGTLSRLFAILFVALFAACFQASAQGASSSAPPPSDANIVTAIPPNTGPLAVCSWLVSGDFPSARVASPPPEGPTGAGFNVDYLAPLGGEAAAHPHAGETVAAPDGKAVPFTFHRWDGPYLDITRVSHAPTDVCVYLYAELESAADQIVYAHVGTNSAGKAWVGGQLLVNYPADRVAMRSQHVVRVALKAGRTPVLLKVDHDGGGWGAFFEVYGVDAQAEFRRKNAPPHMSLVADNYLPVAGTPVTVRIADWIPSEAAAPVNWELVDGAHKEKLDASEPATTITVKEGAERPVVLRASAPLPLGGVAVGDCTVLVGGEAAARHAIDRLESLKITGKSLEALEGPRRDAYGEALYRLERLDRAAKGPNLASAGSDDAKSAALLRAALDAFEQGASPYAGKTGLVEAAYVCAADETAQPFMLSIPQSYDASRRFALLVYLHGAGQTHEAPNSWWQPASDAAHSQQTIGVAVLGRGRRAGYAGLGERDVLDVISWVRARYSIDPDRVYLIGSSMGGGGTWRLAAQYPDTFAAAMADCGYPQLPILPNLLHVPFYANHGGADVSVPPVWSRLGTDTLTRLGSPVVYTEYPGVDHAVGIPVTAEGYMTRLAVHRRVSEPSRIRIHAEHPRYARMYWGAIEQWTDAHALATLDASILPGNVIGVDLANVDKATVTPPARWLTADGDITWMVGKKRLTTPRSADGAYDIVKTADGIAVGPHVDAPSPIRPYVQGSYMELYRGEPLLIVYGTAAQDAAVVKAMKTFAEGLSRMACPGRPMEFGQIPIVSDAALTDEQSTRCNLILVGGPGENAVTRRVMPKLPIREEGNVLNFFGVDSVPLANRGYAFVHPNPERPERLLFVYASREASYYVSPTINGAAGARLFAESWQDLTIPDCVVETIDKAKGNSFARLRQFSRGWRYEGGKPKIACRRPSSEGEYREMVAEAVRRATGASFALSPKPVDDRPCPYDSSIATWEDIWALLANDRTLVSLDLSGAQVAAYSEPKKGSEWTALADPKGAKPIDPAVSYGVGGALDSLWSLGSLMGPGTSLTVVDDPKAFEAAAREVWLVKK